MSHPEKEIAQFFEAAKALFENYGMHTSATIKVAESDFLPVKEAMGIKSAAFSPGKWEEKDGQLQRHTAQMFTLRHGTKSEWDFFKDRKGVEITVMTTRTETAPAPESLFERVTDETPEQGEGEFKITTFERIQLGAVANQSNQ